MKPNCLTDRTQTEPNCQTGQTKQNLNFMQWVRFTSLVDVSDSESGSSESEPKRLKVDQDIDLLSHYKTAAVISE